MYTHVKNLIKNVQTVYSNSNTEKHFLDKSLHLKTEGLQG